MKNKLKFENLMNTYLNEDGTMDLEFQTIDHTYILKNAEIPENIDEFYWDNEKNVKNAIAAAADDDIMEVK